MTIPNRGGGEEIGEAVEEGGLGDVEDGGEFGGGDFLGEVEGADSF